MRLFRKILCPIDFSSYSVTAFRYAAALARDHEAQLILYHSVPDLSQAISYLEGNYIETVHENLVQNARIKLEEFAAGNADAKDAVLTVGNGSPAESILKIAREMEVDLLVMGTHGYTGPERFFLGSVTNKVLHKSVIPVLVVCHQSHHFVHPGEQVPVRIRKILCAVDLEPNNIRIRDLALAVGRVYDSEVTFLHVIPGNECGDDDFERGRQKLEELLKPEKADGRRIRFDVCGGDPGQAILRLVTENEIDLVVMGHHTRRPIEELFLGSVAKRVVVDSRCPVLVVRSRSEMIYP